MKEDSVTITLFDNNKSTIFYRKNAPKNTNLTFTQINTNINFFQKKIKLIKIIVKLLDKIP